MRELIVITDLQFGSTGKGLLAGILAQKDKPDVLVTAWGPNAGHTFVDGTGKKFVHSMLANGIVADSVQNILIGPGSVVNPRLLQVEMENAAPFLQNKQVHIHEGAAIVTDRHAGMESEWALHIGSTMKGTAEAMMHKMRRFPKPNANIAGFQLINTPLEGHLIDDATYQNYIGDAHRVLVEGCQGYSLSIDHGFYPYTTSRNCTVHAYLADCGIPFSPDVFTTVWGCARTYPIRVANRFKDGKMIGWSGPGYHDQDEIDWADIGQEPELTTVTQLPRRIFTFSDAQFCEALYMNGVTNVFMNFMNYVPLNDHKEFMRRIDRLTLPYKATVSLYGFGPSEDDVAWRSW